MGTKKYQVVTYFFFMKREKINIANVSSDYIYSMLARNLSKLPG